MLRHAALAAIGVAAAAILALRARWSDPAGKLLRWRPDAVERNSRIAVMAVLVPLAVVAIALASVQSSLEKEITDLARALSGAELTNLDEVPDGSVASLRLAAIRELDDADDVYALCERWRPALEAKESAVRTSTSYRLWLCAWLLRAMGDSRGDDFALALWQSGDFIKPAIKDRLRTGEQLAAALDDPDPVERRLAARILGEIDYKPAAEPLEGALDDPDEKVREYAALALGRAGDTRHAAALEKLLRDPSRDVRAATAEALGRIGTSSVVESLEGLYRRDEDWQVRTEVIRTLGKIGAVRAGPVLITALSDRHDRVRRAALTALKRLGPAVAPLLDETIALTASPAVREAAREARAAVGSLSPTTAGATP